MTLGEVDDSQWHSLDWNLVHFKCVRSDMLKYCLHPGLPSTHAGIHTLLCNMAGPY